MPRIAIVGAGIGGLALYQGLRADGHDVTVYERSADAYTRPLSYGLHINAWGLDGLRDCLPDEAWQRLLDSSVPALDVIRYWDTGMTEEFATVDFRQWAGDVDPELYRRAVSRDLLRDELLTGINDRPAGPGAPVQWGHRLTDLTSTDGGSVALGFDNGETVSADLAVGADGANSAVRSLRYQDLRRQRLEIASIVGSVPLQDWMNRDFPAGVTDTSVNQVVGTERGWLFLCAWPGPGGVGDPRSRMVWAWWESTATFPYPLDVAVPTALDYISGQIAHWAPAARRLLSETAAEDANVSELTIMPPIPELPDGPVTLLGDAVHNVPPTSGLGANAAIRDASLLRAALRDDPAKAVAAYQEAMRRAGDHVIALSAGAAGPLTGADRPGFIAWMRSLQADPDAMADAFGRQLDSVL